MARTLAQRFRDRTTGTECAVYLITNDSNLFVTNAEAENTMVTAFTATFRDGADGAQITLDIPPTTPLVTLAPADAATLEGWHDYGILTHVQAKALPPGQLDRRVIVQLLPVNAAVQADG